MRMRWMVAVIAAALLVGCGGKGPDQKAGEPQGGSQQASGTQQGGQSGQTAPSGGTTSGTGKAKPQWTAPPAMQIDVNKQYFATLKTALGDIRIQLFTKDAPKTVNNFVFLAQQGFYDGVTFHRIIKDFMIQTGDPKGDGTGGPGYRFADELPPKQSYDPGIVAMANAGANTNGSQFFICNGPGCVASLNHKPDYTQFGKVVEGMDVVQRISSVPVVRGGDGNLSKPVNPPVIEKVSIDVK